jgi:23S rRNA (cytidine1920-2'-O)/16S rRNA (cytidine1409-2'-O)-methyltransferase
VAEVVRAAGLLGWGLAGVIASPLPGPSGNVEFFVHLRQDAPFDDASLLQGRQAIDDAVEKGGP